MIHVAIVLLVVCGVAIIYSVYQLWRNELVYKIRIDALDRGLEFYHALPPYNRMCNMLFTFKYDDFVARKNVTPKLLRLVGIKLREE